MGKKQRLSGYFILAFFTILMIHNYYGSAHVEIISYSQFKSVLNKGLINDLAIGETAIEGNLKGEAVKEIFTPEKIKKISREIVEGKKTFPFETVRVEDPGHDLVLPQDPQAVDVLARVPWLQPWFVTGEWALRIGSSATVIPAARRARAARSTRSTPQRAAGPWTTEEKSAKPSRGNAVSSPSSPSDSPVVARICSRTGPTEVSAGRRLDATRRRDTGASTASSR